MITQGKVAIITGAGQGIGLEIALQLAKQGVRVLLNDIDTNLAHHAAQYIQEQTDNECIALAGDSGEMSFISQMVDTAVHHFGRLDIVIANAGITLFGDFLTYSFTDFMRVMQVNLAGSFFLAQVATKQIIKQGKGGTLLFMSSVTGHQAHKNLAAYSMSKAALEMLAKNLVVELSE